MYLWYSTLGQLSSRQACWQLVFQYPQWGNWSMVTVFLWVGVPINALLHQVQPQHSSYQQAFQEPYDGNHYQLLFVPHHIQKIIQNVLRDGHLPLEMGQGALQLFGWSKVRSQQWSHTYLLLLRSCCMHWDLYATACIQGTYVACSSKGIQWRWGMYLIRGKMRRLVVEWTGTLYKYRHSCNDFDRFNSYGGLLEL